MIPVIAQDAGMDEAATRETLASFVFPALEEQLGAKWLGGGAQSFMQGVAGVFTEAGSIPAAVDTYADTIDTAPLTAASQM